MVAKKWLAYTYKHKKQVEMHKVNIPPAGSYIEMHLRIIDKLKEWNEKTILQTVVEFFSSEFFRN